MTASTLGRSPAWPSCRPLDEIPSDIPHDAVPRLAEALDEASGGPTPNDLGRSPDLASNDAKAEPGPVPPLSGHPGRGSLGPPRPHRIAINRPPIGATQ